MESTLATIPVPPTSEDAEFVPPSPEETPYWISTEQFYEMIDAGIFSDESRVFLWDGVIYEKMAKTQPHAVSGGKAVLEIVRLLPKGWFPWSENPFTVSDDKAPLPDVTVLRGKPDDYRKRRPDVADAALVMEVAQTSLRIDTGKKLAAYARASIPNYWVVNLVGDLIQAYSGPIPAESRFETSAAYTRGQKIVLVLDETHSISIAVDDLLPAKD